MLNLKLIDFFIVSDWSLWLHFDFFDYLLVLFLLGFLGLFFIEGKLFETERLIIRLLALNDAQSILKLLNEPSFIENIGDKQVRTIADAVNYIEKGSMAMQLSLGFSLYACQLKKTNEFIGLSGLIKRDGIEHPEVGFAFFPQFCRKGYGFESASAVINHAVNQLNIKTLQAICNIDNHASNQLLLKLGYAHQGQITLNGAEQKINLYKINKE